MCPCALLWQTQFEGWLSFMRASANGLVSAPTNMRRCTMTLLHGTGEQLKSALVEEWATCNAHQAYHKLSSPDVAVANQSDKEVQLGKVMVIDEAVKSTFGDEPEDAVEAAAAPGAQSPRPSGRLEAWGSGDAWLPQLEKLLEAAVNDAIWANVPASKIVRHVGTFLIDHHAHTTDD